MHHKKPLLSALIIGFLAVFMVGQGCPMTPPDDGGNGGDNGGDDGGDNGGDDGDGIDTSESRHDIIFTQILTNGYVDTNSCLVCHSKEGEDFLTTAHWLWQGPSTNIQGHENEIHGKRDLINNFCIAVPSNEGRCSQCHAGIGWRDNTFDFTNPGNIDCLVCHDQTGTYAKDPTGAGAPVASVDLQAVAKSVGTPTRKNCGTCHFYAGGGDNVKHGDLSSDLVSPTREMDFHMGTDSLDFACQDCHFTSNHEISGMSLHSVGEGITACTTCHGSSDVHDQAALNLHLDAVACQTCHIPAISRTMPTKVEWYWDEAGQDISPIPTDEFGKPTYDKKKGRFVWDKSIRPELRWFNGKWERKIINADDTFTGTPVVLADPVGDITDLSAKIYPFKKMIGRQPADAVNDRLLVPHLFPGPAGDHAYWKDYDWGLALQEGAAYAGQDYSGQYEFVDTVMYLSVNHEVAPAENALGCEDCHAGGIDFTALGYSADPWNVSERD